MNDGMHRCVVFPASGKIAFDIVLQYGSSVVWMRGGMFVSEKKKESCESNKAYEAIAEAGKEIVV